MKGSVLGRRFEYTLLRPVGAHYYSGEWEAYAKKHQDMCKWCSEQKFDHWGTEGNTFWFKFEKDYALFLLRWGG